MSESTPTQAPAVTWRTRAVRRVAGSVGAAVVIAGVAPALANAAGADVPNPVGIALRASGRGLSSAFSPSSSDSVAACDPAASPVVTVSTEAGDSVESPLPSDSPTVEESATAEPVETTAEPVETTAAPSADPTESATGSGTDTNADTDADAGEDCEESASPTAEPTLAPTTEAPESEAPEDGTHGQIVSTVAKCAPRGKDPLLSVEGAPSNHGGYVRPAAHGESLTTPWGTFDLSTQAGADALCAAVDQASAEVAADEQAEKERGKKDRVKKEKGAKGGKGKRAVR